LPLYFSNSFWSQDYRKGLEVLYTKLEQVRGTAHVSKRHKPHIADVSQGVLENSELIAFIRVSVRILHGGYARSTYNFYRPEHRQRRILALILQPL
jgi:hypothetical protein